MAINLQKGQRENINAPKFTVGLGWDINNTSTGTAFDLDASLFLLGDDKNWFQIITLFSITTLSLRINL